MIAGIGTDITDVARIAAKIRQERGFRELVFSPAEIEYCEMKKSSAEHYAGRFAAKEAFLKASGIGLQRSFELHQIEVVNDESGKPGFRLSGTFLRLQDENQWKSVHLSISHIESVATAVVIIEK